MNQVADIIFGLAILLPSIIIHEVSHGAVAYMLGDSTAKDEGRLTLNPIPHIDFTGSIIIPILTLGRLGWAKPVPYNPFYLRRPKWLGKISPDFLVGLAGPTSNIFLAVVFGLMSRFFSGVLPDAFIEICLLITVINLSLAIFNLVPVAPLDGSKVLFAVLPARLQSIQTFLEQYGFMVLLVLIFIMPGLLFAIIGPIRDFLFYLITGLEF